MAITKEANLVSVGLAVVTPPPPTPPFLFPSQCPVARSKGRSTGGDHKAPGGRVQVPPWIIGDFAKIGDGGIEGGGWYHQPATTL